MPEVLLGRKIILFIFAAALALMPFEAMAGFKATPIKVYFDNKTKTAVLSVENDGDDKTTIQVEAMAWSQDEKGNDQYTPTKDLIFFPKIVSIEKGEEKIIRVGYEGAFAANEKTYRLFLQELPVRKEGDPAVNIALRMGLPVFVKAVKETPAMSIESLKLAKGSLEVMVKNSGNSHIIVSKIKAQGTGPDARQTFAREIGGWYALAGRSRAYSIDVPKAECLQTKEIKVQVTVDKTVMEEKLAVNKGMCSEKP
jgi:fimbrial chaperone protein